MNVHQNLFGVNFLFTETDTITAHDLTDNNSGNQESYLTKVLEYGFKSMRYPGGSITENIALDDIMKFFDPSVTVSLQEMINTATSKNIKINLVIPTFVFIKYPEKIVPFFNKLKTYNLSMVETIEIGNEYWAFEDGKDTRWFTEATYGTMANTLIPHIVNLKNSKCPDAKIFIQSAPSWKRGALTSVIHSKIIEANLKNVDGSVDHWYPNGRDKVNSDYFFKDLRNETDNPPVYLGIKQTPQRTLDIMKKYGKTWLYSVSEWNVNAKTADEVMYGADQGIMLARMIHKMSTHNINYAQLWGFHYQYLESKLTGVRSNGKTYDNAAGTIFKEISKTVGWTPVDTPNFLKSSLVPSTFKKGNTYKTFLKTLGTQLTIPANGKFSSIIKFIPYDDPSTTWVDESLKSTNQQVSKEQVSSPETIKTLDKWTHYVIGYTL